MHDAEIRERARLRELERVRLGLPERDTRAVERAAVLRLASLGQGAERIQVELCLAVEPERRAGRVGHAAVLGACVGDDERRRTAALLRERDAVEAVELPAHAVT